MYEPSRKVILGLSAVALFLTPAASTSQGVFNMGMLTNTLSQGANVQSEQARASRRTFPSLLRAPSRTVRPNPAAALYRPSAAVRKRNLAQFVEQTRRVDPVAGADLARAFASNDIIGQISAEMRRKGLNPNSVADAMAAYLVVAWYAVRGSNDSKTADFLAVSRQLSRSVAATPAFASANDATKQEVAESMLIQAVMAEQNLDLIKKTNPKLMPQFKTAVATGARRTFGFDLNRMRLGANGLE